MTADFPAPNPIEDADEGHPWEKAFAQNSIPPEVLEDLPAMVATMLHDHLELLANERYGEGRWVERGAPVLEEVEVLESYRHRERTVTDEDGEPVLDADGEPVTEAYYDDSRYMRMHSWFRAKGEGE